MVLEVILSGLSINTIVGEEETTGGNGDASREDKIAVWDSSNRVDSDSTVDGDGCRKDE